MAVNKELDCIAMIGRDVYGFDCIRRVSPMADNVEVGHYALHDAIDVVSLLGETDGIHLAADASYFAAVLAAIGI